MEFKLVEDEGIPGGSISEGEIDSEEFFGLEKKEDFLSEGEEDMWEDSEDKENINWTVEKVQKKVSKTKKRTPLVKNILQYKEEKILTINSIIERVESVNRTRYVLDRTGDIYQHRENKLRKIEVKKEGREVRFKDFAVIGEDVLICLTKSFHSFVRIDLSTGIIREVNLYQYKDKIFRRVRRTEDGFIVVGDRTIYLYNRYSILIDRILTEDTIVDVIEGVSDIIILTESRVSYYCKTIREITVQSEILINPTSICAFGTYLAVGGKGGVTLLRRGDLGYIKDIPNLESVTSLEYMESMNILIFGDKNRINGLRMYNVKEDRIITTFPSNKEQSYIGGFKPEGRSLYFGRSKSLFSLTVPGEE